MEKKDGSERLVINLKALNQFMRVETFQDRGSSHPPRSSSIRGLDGEDGPKRCIPSGAHQSQPSTPPFIPVGGEVLHVHMSTLQSLSSTEGIHQIAETSGGLPTSGGMPSDNILG